MSLNGDLYQHFHDFEDISHPSFSKEIIPPELIFAGFQELNIVIRSRSHAMARIRERLQTGEDVKKIIASLNITFNAGFYDEGRQRIYVGPLGYFGIGESRRHPDGYFAMTFYRGLPPPNYRPNANIVWLLDE